MDGVNLTKKILYLMELQIASQIVKLWLIFKDNQYWKFGKEKWMMENIITLVLDAGATTGGDF